MAFDHAESVRNRQLAEHAMKQRRKQDAGLRVSFARQEKARSNELSLFTAMMEER